MAAKRTGSIHPQQLLPARPPIPPALRPVLPPPPLPHARLIAAVRRRGRSAVGVLRAEARALGVLGGLGRGAVQGREQVGVEVDVGARGQGGHRAVLEYSGTLSSRSIRIANGSGGGLGVGGFPLGEMAEGAFVFTLLRQRLQQ